MLASYRAGCAKLPSRLCACGVANDLDARYCRACRAELTDCQRVKPSEVHPGKVSFLEIAGSFRQPPSAARSWLCAHTREGVVLRFVPRADAHPCEAGRFKLPEAGLNRAVLADVQSQDPNFARGWAYFVATPSGIEALHIATARNFVLYQARSGEPVAANSTDADCFRMRGIAADAGHVAFLVQQGPQSYTLMSQVMSVEAPPEALLVLSGERVAGPLLCGRRLAACTERQVGIADLGSGGMVADLPRWFAPMLEVDNGNLNLPLGGSPLVLPDDQGQTVWVAGWRSDHEGLLEMDLENPESASFRPFQPGSVLSTQADGRVCLGSVGEIQIVGGGMSRHIDTSLKGSMPVSLADPFLVWFDDHPYPEKQRMVMAWGEDRFRVEFDSFACTPESCCGAYVVEDEFAVAYLDPQSSGEPAELKIARCNLAGGQ